MKGLSATNLKYCKYFYSFYKNVENKPLNSIRPQVVEELQVQDNQLKPIFSQVVEEIYIKQLILVPWGHHRLILDKIKDIEQAIFYINKTIENSWSRAVLEYQIDTNLFLRTGNVKTNFKATLPEPNSDLANEIVKNEYNFEFLI